MAISQFEEVRRMKRHQPFVSFRILTTRGERFLVEGRFQFAVGQTEMMYVPGKSEGFVRLTADEIAGVEVIEQKPAA